MKMLDLEDTLDGLARASDVQWYRLVLKRNNNCVLRKALDFKMTRRRGRVRPKMPWQKQVEK